MYVVHLACSVEGVGPYWPYFQLRLEISTQTIFRLSPVRYQAPEPMCYSFTAEQHRVEHLKGA
jgi:hypothetical protein